MSEHNSLTHQKQSKGVRVHAKANGKSGQLQTGKTAVPTEWEAG